MTAFTATFADGTSIRVANSKHNRTHAFKVSWSYASNPEIINTRTGWAGSAELARKGADAYTTEARNEPRNWKRYSRKPWVAGVVHSLEIVPAVAS